MQAFNQLKIMYLYVLLIIICSPSVSTRVPACSDDPFPRVEKTSIDSALVKQTIICVYLLSQAQTTNLYEYENQYHKIVHTLAHKKLPLLIDRPKGMQTILTKLAYICMTVNEHAFI